LTLHDHQHKTFLINYHLSTYPVKKAEINVEKKSSDEVHSIVERKSREDPIIDRRKVENNAIDYQSIVPTLPTPPVQKINVPTPLR